MENKFKFLTKYSLSKKIKNKWFLVVNIILFVALVALTNIDSIVNYFGGDFNESTKISVIDNTGYYDTIKTNLEVSAKQIVDKKFVITKEKKELKQAKKKIEGTKKILLVINKDEKNIFNGTIISDSYMDTLTYQTIVSTLNSTKQSIAFSNSNIDPNLLADISKEVVIKREFINEDKTKDEEDSRMFLSMASLIIVLPCFMLIIFLVQMVGAEINEEKSTRGMEIIIGNVSAKVHFYSKVIASNLFILLQAGLLMLYGFTGLVIRKLTGSASITTAISSNMDLSEIFNVITKNGIVDKLSYMIPLILILIILSFLAYALFAGILASMTTNMENFQQLQTPVALISVVGYYLVILSSIFPGASFIKVISVIPLFSVSLAPCLLLSGEITVIYMIIAILLLVLLNFILIKYGLKIYKVGILNYSETGLWKKMLKALKQKN